MKVRPSCLALLALGLLALASLSPLASADCSACSASQVCESSTTCVEASTVNGGGENQICREDFYAPRCNGALVCQVDVTCQYEDYRPSDYGAQGKQCRSAQGVAQCDSGLVCYDGLCQTQQAPAQGTIGGSCMRGGLCNSPLLCRTNDNLCVNASSTSGGAQGQQCREGYSPNCDGGLICQIDGTCQTEGYIPPGAQGGQCRTGAGVAPCQGDLVCTNGVCGVAPSGPAAGALGGECMASWPYCNSMLACLVANRTCVTAPAYPAGAMNNPCRSQAYLPLCADELVCQSNGVCQPEGYKPQGGEGQTCRTTAPQCDGDLACEPVSNMCQRPAQQPTGGQGQKCRDSTPRCDGDLICQVDGTCQFENYTPAGSLGGQCRSGAGVAPCDGDLTCTDGLCAVPKGPSPGALGGACMAVWPYCYNSLACLVANQTCVTAPAFPAGAMNNPCRSDAFAPRCTDELICQPDGVCQPEGYKQQGGEGQTCRTTAPQCDANLACEPVSNMCQRSQSTTGGQGQKCRDSTPRCDGDLICQVDGTCQFENYKPAGSLGGQCRSGAGVAPCDGNMTCFDGLCALPKPLDPCSLCSANQNCFSGKCFDKPTACDPACKIGYLCSNGTCIVNGGSTVDGKCTTNAMCGGRMCNAATMTCQDWPEVQLDCGGSCPSGQECRLGACIAKQTVKQCSPACNAAWGQTCNTVAGVCVGGGNVTCVDCTGGVCQKAVTPNTAPTCLMAVAGAPASCGKPGDASCPANSYCRSSVCVECTGVCRVMADLGADSTATQTLMTTLVSGGINPASITSVQTAAAVQQAVSADGKLTFQPGTLMQIDSSVGGVKELVMSATAESAARVSGDHALQAMTVTGSSSKIVLESGKLETQSLSVGAGGALTLSVPSGAAPVLNMSSLALNGALNLVGGTGVQLVLPATAAGVSVGSGATMSIGGGSEVVVSGHCGSTPISLEEGSVMSTPAGGEFVSNGPLLGGGEMQVAGTAILSSTTVEVALVMSPGGTLAIDTSAALASGSGAQTLADVDFSGSSGTMELRGSTTSGDNLFVSELKSCPEGAMLRYRVDGEAQAAVDNGMTFFNYGAATFTNAANFVCDIEVCGTEGACVVIRNPNVPVTSRRRLLADVAASASFEPTKLSVSGKGKSAGNAAAGMSASPVLVALLALVAAFVAQRR